MEKQFEIGFLEDICIAVIFIKGSHEHCVHSEESSELFGEK
jgi:hypothetical protein